MPRDSSGTYSRIIPPGAAGYQFNTDIKETEVNGEIEDIGLALTNSLTKNGVTTPTSDLPMGGFVHSGLGQANANGETVRYQALAKATGLAVTASGLQTLPFEGSWAIVSGTGFNITGFNNIYDGRTVSLRMPEGLTLVNSATFSLPGGVDIVTKANDILTVVQDAAGVWRGINYAYALGKPHLSCHRNGVDTAAIGATPTKLVWTTAASDNYGMLNTTTGTITIKTAGTYAITMQGRAIVTVDGITGNLNQTDSVVYLYLNGATFKFFAAANTDLSDSAAVNCTAKLAVGDTLETYFQNIGSTAAVVRGSINNTFCTVAML